MIVFEPLHPAPRLPVGSGHALQPGERLEEFEITQVLGLTSFGIIYLAQDVTDHRLMAIKEYLPVTIAARGEDGRVELRDATHEEVFQRGLQSFVTEALTLSQFDHPHLLRVSCVWEGNGTGYRAMPHYGGTNLLAHRFSSKQPPDQVALGALLKGLSSALKVLHDAGLSHGQLEPMNIMVRDDGHATLLDFDAARHAILSDPRLPFVDSYADQEHLAENQAADLQALAAVLHFAVSGQWVPSSPGATRRYEPLGMVVPRLRDSAPDLTYDARFLAAIDTALALKGDDRPRSVAQFLALFDPESKAGAPLPVEAAMPSVADAHMEMPLRFEVPGLPLVAHAQVVQQPRLKRVLPRSIPERPVHEFPLNSSESVLELLAGFGRTQQPGGTDDAEPFESPLLPTLNEEAEPALPPLRESLFDEIDSGQPFRGGAMGHGRSGPQESIHAPPPSRYWRRIAAWSAALMIIAIGAIGLRWS